MVEGRFELLNIVDEGGTSIVYQAKDQKTGGLVALKMLREELSTQQEYVENFRGKRRRFPGYNIKISYILSIRVCIGDAAILPRNL